MGNWTIEQIVGGLGLITAFGAGIKYLLTPVINYNTKQI